LQKQYAALAELIETHLFTVLQKSRHEVAVEFVSQARRSFSWLTSMARQNNGFDTFVFRIGSPIFDWGDEQTASQPSFIDTSLPKVRN
jgi:hypothetical protein